MTHAQFVKKYLSLPVDYDGRYGYQCVDLMRRYIKDLYGLSPYVAVPAAATAKLIYQNFRSNKYLKKVPNTPTGVPKQGDIVFWGFYPGVTGLPGHVAIFHEGDVNRFVSLDQNYPTGSFTQFVRHSYKGVMGWLTRV